MNKPREWVVEPAQKESENYFTRSLEWKQIMEQYNRELHRRTIEFYRNHEQRYEE